MHGERPTTMDSGQQPSVQMEQKPSALLSFLGRRPYAPRPLSEATDFFDLDFEEGSDGSSPFSREPLDDDSQTTVSGPDEVSTPLTGGLGGFEFHFDSKPVQGPVGPHLFRPSSTSLPSDLDDSFTAEYLFDYQPKTPSRPFTSLNTAVAELDESQVRDWKPRQVADWMAEAGFEASVVEKFLIHDISGSVLLDLQFEDLKELDISSFGKRHRVMSSIQHLRNSSMISLDVPLSKTPSRSPRTIQRSARPEECHVVPDRSLSRRRGRSGNNSSDVVTPAESISIVAIEQLLPKPHKCSKGEDCAKWQKQQRKLLRIQQEFTEEALKSEAAPSVVGSSDVLGPAPPFKITAELLSEIAPRDAQENVRQFLSFQMQSSNTHSPSPPPAASASFVAKPNLADNLRGLPKLTIPAEHQDELSSSRPPISALHSSTQIEAQNKLSCDPFHYGGVASPVDVYRMGTPFSTTDIPVTAEPSDPCGRNVSQSVPPEMRYGAGILTASPLPVDPVLRCVSTQPSTRRRLRQPSFNPSVAPVRENIVSPTTSTSSQPPIVTTESQDLLNYAGWMRKRKTTRLLRHEWTDNYLSLAGNRLVTLESDLSNAVALDSIDVDDYAVHAYSTASGSKLSAAFKKSILGSGHVSSNQPSFAFSLIPDTEKGHARNLEKNSIKSHHFAVKSGSERVEWMRRLMLAKAASRNETSNIL